MKRVGLVLHAGKPEALETARWIVSALADRGLEAVASVEDAARIDSEAVTGVAAFDDGLDLVLALGGDGTLLRAADRVAETGVPLLGVNLGNLGFLSELERADLGDGLAGILDRGFDVEERLVLSVELEDRGVRTHVRALNDVIVEKVSVGRAIRLAVAVGGEPLVSWSADGVIVATSTGSTAYSFSAGGPVISPRLDCMVITPVSPHLLFDRSVVVPGDEEIVVTVLPDPDGAQVSADGGPAHHIAEGARVRIGAAADRVRLAKVDGAPFWRLVREKFRLPAEGS